MTDCDYLLELLADGEWHALADILARSQTDRGHGLTVHSRASNLRSRGYGVEQRGERDADGRCISYYRLVDGPCVASTPAPRYAIRDRASHDTVRKLLAEQHAGVHCEWVTQRLAANIQIDDSGCWIWRGPVGNNGYGLFHFGRARLGHDPLGRQGAQAHRVAYETFNGLVPDGLYLDHICRNKHCVNPSHLEPVTASENKRRDWEARTDRVSLAQPDSHSSSPTGAGGGESGGANDDAPSLFQIPASVPGAYSEAA